MEITKDLVRQKFDYSYYQRGVGYKNKVSELEVTESNGGYNLEAKVKGNSYLPYEVLLYIRDVGSVYFNGECSCPVGYNCKHIIAVILVAIEKKLFKEPDPSTKRRKNLDSWLSKLSDIDVKDNLVERTHKVFYLLTPSRDKGLVNLDMSARRKLKNGTYGKVSSVNLNASYYPQYFSIQDMEIARLIESLQDSYHKYASLELSGMSGASILKKVLETGACHYENSDSQAFSKGENLNFELSWSENKSNNFELQLKVKDSSAEILTFEPLMYMDTTTMKIGMVDDLAHDTQTVQLLLQAPEVNKEDLNYLSEKLLIEMPRVNIPAPSTDFIKILDALTPKFFMKIQGDKRIFKAEVFIKYAEHTVKLVPSSSNETIKDKSDGFIQVQRDVQLEISTLKQLETFGLELYEINKLYALGAKFTGGKQTQYAQADNFFSKGLEILTLEGWDIEVDEEAEMKFELVEQIEGTIDENNHWFDLRFDMSINGKQYNTIPIIASLLNSVSDVQALPDKIYLEIEGGSVAVVDKKTVLPIIEVLFELFDHDEGSFKINSFDAPVLTQLQNASIDFSGSSKLLDIAKKLESFEGIEKAKIPKGLNATLRDYQADGYSWLQFLREYSFAGILADDMGLGKTIQALTHLLKEKESGRLNAPSLVIAPTSLMSNWRKEAEKFTPDLKVLVLQGQDRKKDYEKVKEYDIILTTYPLIVRDFDKYLKQTDFYYLILDEAQNIKNHKSKAAQHLRAIKSEHRLCLTGTPMENHLGELWGLFDFLMPGFLFNNKFFNDNLRYPIEKDQDMNKQSVLNKRVKPFLLRRTKNEVATELPPKTEIIQTAPLGTKQAALYESIRVAMDKQVRDAIKDKGFARSQIMILDALLKLRQVCCDPRLVKLARAKEVKESAKFEMLFDLLLEQIEEGRKILLFSQFTSMLALIEERLKKEKINYTKLTGSTRKREEAIEKFTSGEVPLFLISLKAGGVGLNLTQADTVIHYDPWWNPAVENQATDRAYRIGQDKPVFVYKLIIENTLEEKIIELQKRKQALADNVYKNKADAIGLSQDDLADLFKPL